MTLVGATVRVERATVTMDYVGEPHPEREIRNSYPVRGRTSGWFFRVEELPTGYWQVKGRNHHGHTVFCVGSDPEDVLATAETQAEAQSLDLGAIS